MRKRNSRLIFLTVAALSLILIGSWIAMGETGANFYSKDEKKFHDQLGDLKVVVLDESAEKKEKSKKQTKLDEGLPDFPIENYLRSIVVENQGAVSQYVRVMLFPVVQDNKGILVSALPTEVVKDLNTSEWKDGGDGYLYYQKKLSSGKKTEPIFNEVTLEVVSENGGTLKLKIKAEAITAEADSFVEAWWNKEVPTEGPRKEIYDTLSSVKE